MIPAVLTLLVVAGCVSLLLLSLAALLADVWADYGDWR